MLFVFIFTFIVSEFVGYVDDVRVWNVAPDVVLHVDVARLHHRQHRRRALGRSGHLGRDGKLCRAVRLSAIHAAGVISSSRSQIIRTWPSFTGSTSERSSSGHGHDCRCALIAVGMLLYGARSQIQPKTSLELMLFATVATIVAGSGISGAQPICRDRAWEFVQNASVLFIPSQTGRACSSTSSCSWPSSFSRRA